MTRVPDTNPYGFVAGAIAGRRVATEWSDNNGHRVYSDGQSIFLPLDDQEAGPLLWATITAQAALIGAGSLHASLLASLVGRPVLAKRYLYLEMLRAAHVLAHRLPWAFTQRLQSQPPRSHSARGSLELAATPLELPEPPAYFGHQASGGVADGSRCRGLGGADATAAATTDEQGPGRARGR